MKRAIDLGHAEIVALLRIACAPEAVSDDDGR